MENLVLGLVALAALLPVLLLIVPPLVRMRRRWDARQWEMLAAVCPPGSALAELQSLPVREDRLAWIERWLAGNTVAGEQRNRARLLLHRKYTQ